MSEAKPNKVQQVIENSYVRLATVVAVVIFAVTVMNKHNTWARNDAMWKLNIDRDMEDLRGLITGGTEGRWHRQEMRAWAKKLQEQNPTLKVPDTDEIVTRPINYK